MLSEVDLRDWDKVDINLLKIARSATNRKDPITIIDCLMHFAEQCLEVREKQLRKIPKLERE